MLGSVSVRSDVHVIQDEGDRYVQARHNMAYSIASDTLGEQTSELTQFATSS